MKHVRGLFQKELKNRSSKHLYFAGLVGPGTKPATWSMSNDALQQLAKGSKGSVYDAELERRQKNAAKRKTPRPQAKRESSSN